MTVTITITVTITVTITIRGVRVQDSALRSWSTGFGV